MTELFRDSLELYVTDDQLSCEDAHRLAEMADMTPAEFARAVSETTPVRFYRCQLGLFGYGPKAQGLSKIVQAAGHVPDAIRADVLNAARDGGISCDDVWRIARQHRYPRLALANIIETMGLRVRVCQLGCF
jgi:hypothetical protein